MRLFVLFAFAALPAMCAITRDPGPIPDLRPLREELSASVEKQRDLLPWFVGTAIIAVVVGVAAVWPKKQPPQPLAPYAFARKELEGLNGTVVTPLVLSTVVRGYLLDAFRIPARGATSEELLHWLAAHPQWDTLLSGETTDFLRECDEAKFSPTQPEQHPEWIERALALIARIERRRLTPAL